MLQNKYAKADKKATEKKKFTLRDSMSNSCMAIYNFEMLANTALHGGSVLATIGCKKTQCACSQEPKKWAPAAHHTMQSCSTYYKALYELVICWFSNVICISWYYLPQLNITSAHYTNRWNSASFWDFEFFYFCGAIFKMLGKIDWGIIISWQMNFFSTSKKQKGQKLN